MTLGGMGVADSERAEQQRVEYKKRGIALVAYETGTNTYPYFTNLDEDAFRSNRFMYIFQKVSINIVNYICIDTQKILTPFSFSRD